MVVLSFCVVRGRVAHDRGYLPWPLSSKIRYRLFRVRWCRFLALVATGLTGIRAPDRVQGDVEHLPLAQIRGNPDKPVFGKKCVDGPAPHFTGFVIQNNDSLPRGKQQERVGFTPCQGVFGRMSSPRENCSRLPQRARGLTGRGAYARRQGVGHPAEVIVAHRRTCPSFPVSCPAAAQRRAGPRNCPGRAV